MSMYKVYVIFKLGVQVVAKDIINIHLSSCVKLVMQHCP